MSTFQDTLLLKTTSKTLFIFIGGKKKLFTRLKQIAT